MGYQWKSAEDPTGHVHLPPMVEMSSTRQTLAWQTQPLRFLHECAQRYGDAFTADFGSHGLYVMFSSPEAIREIFGASNEVLYAGRGNRVLKPLLGSRSLLLLEGRRHIRERRVLLPGLHAEALEHFTNVIQCVALEALSEAEAGRRRDGDEIAVQGLMQAISMRVILQAVLGLRRGPRVDELGAQLQCVLNDSKLSLGLLDQLQADVGSPAWQAFQGVLKNIDDMILQEVTRRRAENVAQSDLLGLLLSAIYEDGTKLDDLALRDEVMTLIVTGYETTAIALTWAFYLLSRESSVVARLRSELEPLGRTPAPAGLTRAKYLRAVCLETLRIRPIIPIVAREAQTPISIQGYEMPAGSTVAAAIYLAHYRAEAFPQPEEFRPDRFLERQPSPFEFLPFGGGVRRCIGMALALSEMQIVLGSVLASHEVIPMDREFRPVRRFITLAPERLDGANGGPSIRRKPVTAGQI